MGISDVGLLGFTQLQWREHYRMNDRIMSQKQKAIGEAVETGLEKVRKEAGLNKLMVDTALGRSAMSMSSSILADIENPEYNQILADYGQLAYSNGYQGTEVGVAYYRNNWPIETPDDLIANEFIDHFLQTFKMDLWEECVLGVSSALDERYAGRLGICIVIGTGWTDGNALVVNYINEERRKRSVRPLNVHNALRLLARQYLAMDTEPDRDEILPALWQVGYAHPRGRTWFDHSGVFAPVPSDKDALTIRDIAKLVTDQYLRDKDLLLNPRWEDVGFATGLQPVQPLKVNPSVPSFVSEFVIAKHISPGFTGHLNEAYLYRRPRRPDPRVEQARRRKRWWWPF